MAEYIEREAAYREICADDTMSGYEKAYCSELIRNIPAANVAQVRHGRWVDNHCTECGMMPMGDEMWKHCDFDPPRFEKFMDYCPSCGCCMDGGAD